MATARFRFSPDLNRFLPAPRRDGLLVVSFEPGQSLKHLIEAAGVPHTEVGEVLVHGQAVPLSRFAQDGDEIHVTPPAPGMGMPDGEPRFVLDGHLGRLAAGLRMLGFDSLYNSGYSDAALAEIAAGGRILLTRDRRLLMRKTVQHGYCPRSLNSDVQLAEVVRRFTLADQIAPFLRCLRCNTPLASADKSAVLDQLEPLTRRYYDEFHSCPSCGQIYWQGSHYERMLQRINTLRAQQ